ncbi:MAG: hypothetical protein ACRYFA_08020 [Janthinobacterium lividum]
MNDNTEHTEWLNEFPALKMQSRKNPFLVPDHYFEEHQEHIRTAIFADELKLRTPQTDFTVPDSYFENMQEQILSAIKLEELRPANESFTTPDTFFDDQQSIITARIKIDKFAEKGRGFSVPDHYFEELTAQITQKTSVKEAQKPAKIRSLFVKATWKYATAACIAVAVTVGIFVKQNHPAKTIQSELSTLPDADIENYLKINSDTYDNHLILESSASDTESQKNTNDNSNFGI